MDAFIGISSFFFHRIKENRSDMLFSELKQKEVINVNDCNKLGFVTDVEFDPCSGCIKRIFVSDKGRWFPNILQEPERSICFKDICQIGPDLICVNV